MTRGWALGLALVLVLTIAACGGNEDEEGADSRAPATSVVTTPPTLDPTCVAARPVETGATVHTVESGGVDRAYLQYVPLSYEGVAMPVVVNLHSTGATAADQASISGIHDTAETHGFVALTPQASGDPASWGRGVDSADVAFVADLLDQARIDFCLERQRVYVVGFGAGGRFAGRLACDLSDRIAAVAVVADVGAPGACRQERPVPFVGLFGSYAGADQGPIPPEALVRWADRYGCRPSPRREEVATDVILGTFRRCDAGAAVEFYVVSDSSNLPPPWPTNASVDAGDLIWAFFVDNPLTSSS